MEVELNSPCGPAEGTIVDVTRPVKVFEHARSCKQAACHEYLSTAILTVVLRVVLRVRRTQALLWFLQVVPILRAGLVPLEQVSTVLPAYETYHVGLVRDEQSFEVILHLNTVVAAEVQSPIASGSTARCNGMIAGWCYRQSNAAVPCATS